jgi:hypothetical protein
MKSAGARVRRFLIVSGVIFVGLVAVYLAPLVLLARGLTRSDPYPAFMMGYLSMGPLTYQDAARTFSDLVVDIFPAGSPAKDAIAQITNGGFEVVESSPDSVELLWRRHNGPCSELYSIAVSQAADGTIAGITGRLQPICL